MANKSASAKKRARQSIKRRARNKSVISNLKSSIKAYKTALDSSEDTKDLLLRKVISLYDKAAAKGVIHKRNASRNISKISKTINK
ncbi:MAG: 30S ribosomal protein S20 [Candidatus Dadabacteria bacterium]|mgnify:FL=1|jgi:small subunit ribosomal protein S20|nr:30S ribosomal protein S20 [Candidatus Dadabacteria bacterium]|tara:strand:+ start:1100 stop:1357 length:258 start_codon:yes stop_codon:yes gene_type:complete